ncbi:MAG: DUF882 domain-containing protein, partial [Pseudomonadota bacterium]
MTLLDKTGANISRRGTLGLAVGAAALIAAPAARAASPAVLKGAGDFRRVHLVNKRTWEEVNTVYWIEGEYIPEAKAEIDFVLRDWRQNLVIDYDQRAVDILAAVYRMLETSEPLGVVSGYRSPATNAMLRRKNRGVAKDSYHTKGMAIDIQMKTRGARGIAKVAR